MRLQKKCYTSVTPTWHSGFMITLRNDVSIPRIGLGVWEVGEDVAQETVESAIDVGYRHIDTAAGYYNEEAVGAALAATDVAREDLFVTTKLRNGDQGYEEALRAFDDSLGKLGLDYLDLYLIHWPVPAWDKYIDTWRAFEKLYEEGRVRAIGISNFLPDHVARLMSSCEVPPMINQFELHPSYQQVEVEASTRGSGMVVEAYSPIGRGDDLKLPEIMEIAEHHEVTPAQVIIAWHLAKDRVVIPKSVHADRQKENLEATRVLLSDEEVAVINGLESGNMKTAHPATAEFTQFRD